MITNSPVPPTWIEKRRQRRKKVILTRTVVTIIILILLTVLLSAIGLLFTVQGGTILAVAAIIATLVAWLFPLSAQTTPSRDVALAKISPLQTSRIASSFQVPQNYNSIFHFATKLSDHRNLYGRETERHTLINRTRQKDSTSLIGPRRIGKSWLIEYLRLVAPTELGSEYRVISIDVTSARCDTVAGFVEYLLDALKEKVNDRQDTCKVLELALDALTKEELKPQPNILAVLERAIQDLSSTNIIPVVCIDEFRGLFDRMDRRRYHARKKEFNMSFFKSLRVMCTSQSMSLVLVIASQDPLKTIVGQAGRTSGFFNIFEQIRVQPFSLSEAEDFIETKGNQALFDDAERDQMLRLGAQGWGVSRRYWPIRLELIGKMILYEKALKPGTYRPKDPNYWKKFKQEMEDTYRRVF